MAFDKTDVCADVQIVDPLMGTVRGSGRKKVALVGFASNSLHLVPWNDPSYEIWSMNQGYMHMHRYADRWFEMHQPEATADLRDPNYLNFLASMDIPIYMTDLREGIPNAVRYPIERAMQWTKRDYFMSTVAYMLVLAAMEGFEQVDLYGINLAIGEEYFYEKPNCEYLIGRLEGIGIKVYVPQASSLLKQFRRYGYHVDARPNASLKVLLNNRIASYRSQAEQHQQNFHTAMGALREAEQMIQVAEGIDHGADIVLIPTAPPTS